MHDDQHGTAIVALAALRGAAQGPTVHHRAARRDLRAARGRVACATSCSRCGHRRRHRSRLEGIVSSDREDLGEIKADLAARTNPAAAAAAWSRRSTAPTCSSGLCRNRARGDHRDDGARVDHLRDVEPDPEIHPDIAAKYAAIVATGRSDFPNQINNVLAFPGVFKAPSTPVPAGSPRA
ncbi:hypothetical protein GS909_21890 [Rhodococcus hoagii]|nr:hypothetical protein [Prescottella equi]